MEASKFLEGLLKKCQALGCRVTVLDDGRIQPEGREPMSDRDFAHWVWEQEKKK